MSARYAGEAFVTRFGPWAVIAGGSDGIGSAFAEEVVVLRLKRPAIVKATNCRHAFFDWKTAFENQRAITLLSQVITGK